jgi:hypothetical protein
MQLNHIKFAIRVRVQIDSIPDVKKILLALLGFYDYKFFELKDGETRLIFMREPNIKIK